MTETLDGPVRSMVIPDEVGQRVVTARSFYEIRATLRRTQLIDAVRVSIPEFISVLRLNVDRPVIDKTGLTGFYQFTVELDVSQVALRILKTGREGHPINMEPTGVSNVKAVEGLGLKLEERRAPIDVLVVDRIERTPTEH